MYLLLKKINSINKAKSLKYTKLLTFIILVAFLVSTISSATAGTELKSNKINIAAKGAYLINYNTGKVLYQKNAHQRMYPASTTKILTALIAIEKGNLNDIVTVGNEIKLVKSDGSRAGLRVGERIYLKDLIRGLMLPSGNDAANTIAVYIGRKAYKNRSLSITDSINKFVYLMNTRAKAIGAKESRFINPHGYHNIHHYTTPHDLALIAREAMKNQTFCEVVSTVSYTTKKIKNEKAGYTHYWINRNDLINKRSKNYYPYATGIKTGHTSQAGHCLVSSATKGKVKIIAVVMNSSDQAQWIDTKKLLNLGLH